MSENRMNNIEKIGKVTLDFTHYPGEDLYCDGEVEDALASIARDCAAVEYPRIIEEKKSWEILYHLSPLRENVVEWLPLNRAMKVLEVGSGCGAITGALSRKAGEVTCVELSKKRSLINAYRHMEADNVCIHVGNFQDVEPHLPCDYDYIFLIGVFEYARAYMASEAPYEDFLNIVKKHAKPGGRIVIAIENRLGLKYWAGCQEDHLGAYFAGIEDYPAGGVVKTFTREGLLATARRCGISEAQMYYPYPDYKFMSALYSDRRLPKRGELINNICNYDRDRMQLFDEKRVFDGLIEDGLFPLFSNSFLLVLGPSLAEEYVKYSNDRKEEFQIKTLQKGSGFGPKIEKHPLCKAAESHIEATARAYEKLAARYRGSLLAVNESRLEKTPEGTPYIEIQFLKGKTLEEILDEQLEKNDLEGFHSLFDEYLKRIAFGEEKAIADFDMIFANIMVSVDDNGCYKLNNTWNLIDCEWTFERVIETREIAFRALYCYLLEEEKRNCLNPDLILDKLGIGPEEAAQYREQELQFQKYVTGKRLSLGELREAIGRRVYTLEDVCRGLRARAEDERVQVYEDTGRGFSEEQSFFAKEDGEEVCRSGEGEVIVSLRIGRGRSALRIDPCSHACLLRVKRLVWNGAEVPLRDKAISTNGFRIGAEIFAFPTEDPGITLSLRGLFGEEENHLEAVWEVTRMPAETVMLLQKRGLFG